MGTKYIRNPRDRPPGERLPKPAPKPEKKSAPKPEKPEQPTPGWNFCGCGCGEQTRFTYVQGHYAKHKAQKASKAYQRPVTAARLPRGDGFGLYACDNCQWYLTPRKGSTKSGCKDAGIPGTARPCTLNRHGHGYFEPVRTPETVKAVDLTTMDCGDLMILQWAAKRQMVEVLNQKITRFCIGDRVRFSINGQWHRGEIVKLTKRYAVVIDATGSQVTLRNHEVELDRDPPASAQ